MFGKTGMEIRAAVVSDAGCRRTNNEDNYLLAQNYNKTSALKSKDDIIYRIRSPNMWVTMGVFDGIGGGESGELASRIAAETIGHMGTDELPDFDPVCITQKLRYGFVLANRSISEKRKDIPVTGTTATVLCTNGEQFRIFHLGDSRAYLYRDGDLYQLTQDQTVAAMKINTGSYTANDPSWEYDRHCLTGYIGCVPAYGAISPVESDWIGWMPGDKVLLCSDGLYDMCADTQIRDILRPDLPLRMYCQLLVDTAYEKGGIDNITCLIIETS